MANPSNWLPPGVHPSLAGRSFFPVGTDKRPAVGEWRCFADRLPTPDEIKAWKGHAGGWGFPCGPLSGFVVVDFDGEEGRKEYEKRFSNGNRLPITATTPGGGYHAFFRYPDGEKAKHLKNAVRVLPGVDIRTHGGYVVLPTGNGDGRSWLQPPDVPATDLPDFVFDALKSPATQQVGAPIKEYDGLPPGVGQGERNKMASIHAGRYLKRGLTAEETASILSAWNQKNSPPLGGEELRSVVFSIARRELAKGPAIELVDSSELEKLSTVGNRKLIDPFLPAGAKAILAGYQGTYKSTLALNWAVSLRNGLPVFGRFDAEKAKVLYIDRENTPDLTNYRVSRIASGLRGARGGISFQFPKEKPDLAQPRVREAYIRLIEKGRFDLVIFDSFLCFFNLRNENDNTEVRNVLELVGEIPAKTGAAMLFIDHAGKASPEKVKGKIPVTPRGASAKGDWADLVMTLEERDHEARKLRVLRFPKTRYNLPMPPMILEVGTNLVMLPSGEDEACPVFTVRQVVEDHPGIGAGELHQKLMGLTGCSKRTAITSTARAVELDFIERKEKGRTVSYRTKEKGELVQLGHCTNRAETEI